ncbi:hypothetical protein [Sphingomonas sp.]|uniref:hypothetical protein n=1 Tax=Sphingomonas sp. TaxID=28214 RepID=UPI0025CC5FBF|nr:hypothetical protein [Sphingomonas sp.]
MNDLVSTSKLFPAWQFNTGARVIVGDPVIGAIGMPIALITYLHYIHARKGRLHVLVIFDRWNQACADSLLEGLCDGEE